MMRARAMAAAVFSLPLFLVAATPAPPGKTPAAKTGKAARAGGAEINAQRAMSYVREIVAIGPRPMGSAGHARVENYLRTHLQALGAQWEEDAFVAQTPAGAFKLRNFIAKFPGTRDGIVVIASHYDTNYSLQNFVGANDGGSSTGLLLELARQLQTRGPRPGQSVWLAFLDGEEAVRQWSATDSVYGSRHLAEKWQREGAAKKIKAFLLADMIGDADLNIDRDQNSTAWLEEEIYNAAVKLGHQSHFFARKIAVQDDHLPFARAGIPVADLIDLDYGYNNVFWHTPQDTLDKLSAKSLAISGNVILEVVRALDHK